MSVNEGRYPDNKSSCAGCERWLDDQVLTQVNDEVWCSECGPCDNCNSVAMFRGGKPVFPRCYNSPVGLCYECAREAISL